MKQNKRFRFYYVYCLFSLSLSLCVSHQIKHRFSISNINWFSNIVHWKKKHKPHVFRWEFCHSGIECGYMNLCVMSIFSKLNAIILDSRDIRTYAFIWKLSSLLLSILSWFVAINSGSFYEQLNFIAFKLSIKQKKSINYKQLYVFI